MRLEDKSNGCSKVASWIQPGIAVLTIQICNKELPTVHEIKVQKEFLMLKLQVLRVCLATFHRPDTTENMGSTVSGSTTSTSHLGQIHGHSLPNSGYN